MKKTILTFIVLSGIAFGGFAQTLGNSNKFSIGVDLGIPVGDAAKVYVLGAGVSFNYDLALSDNLSAVASAGYTAMIVKDELTGLGYQSVFKYIPLKAGLKFYFGDGYYAEAQAGGTIFAESGGGGMQFAYAPALGYKFSDNVDIAVRYEVWTKGGSNVTQAALRLAYSF